MITDFDKGDLSDARARNFLPPNYTGMGAVAIQVKNYKNNLSLGAAYELCRKQVARLAVTLGQRSGYPLSVLFMAGDGKVTSNKLPEANIMLFVENYATKLSEEEQDAEVNSNFVGLIINGFHRNLVDDNTKEALETLTRTLSNSASMLRKQLVSDDLARKYDIVCKQINARLPSDFDVESFEDPISTRTGMKQKTTEIETKGKEKKKSSGNVPAPSSLFRNWSQYLVPVTQDNVKRSLVVFV